MDQDKVCIWDVPPGHMYSFLCKTPIHSVSSFEQYALIDNGLNHSVSESHMI